MALPSWKIIVAFLIVLIAGSIFVIKPSILGNKTAFVQDEKGVKSVSQTITRLDADSDGDGLLDWEEKLIGTDPNNPDTDGDGVPDSAEEAAGKLRAVNQKIAEAYKKDISATDRLAQDILNQYYRSLQYENPSNAPPRSYSLKDYSNIGYDIFEKDSLAVGKDDSDSAVRAYATAIGSTIIKYNVPDGNELNIISESVSREDEERIKELDPIVARYESLIEVFLKTEVPPSLVEIHLGLLNSYKVMLESVLALRGFYTDPVETVLAFDTFPKSAQALLSALKKSEEYFASRNISFSNTEPGYILTYALRDAKEQ